MTIEDNGRGFTPHQPHRTEGGFGLIGLEERVKRIKHAEKTKE